MFENDTHMEVQTESTILRFLSEDAVFKILRISVNPSLK